MTLRFNVISELPTLLQPYFHEVQQWVQQVNEVKNIAHSFANANTRSSLGIIWTGDESLYKHRTDQSKRQQPDWWNDVWTCFALAIPRGVNLGAIRHWTPLQLFVEPETNFIVLFNLPSTATAKHSYWSCWLGYIDKCLSVCPRRASRAVRRRFRRNKARIAPRLCPNPTVPQNEQHACLAAWRSHFACAGSQGLKRSITRIKRRVRRIREQHSVHINSGQPFTLLELGQALHLFFHKRGTGCR